MAVRAGAARTKDGATLTGDEKTTTAAAAFQSDGSPLFPST